MKTNSVSRRHSNVISFSKRKGYAYPNAAERSYFFNKAMDYALAAATSLGTVTILVFLIILG